MDENEKLLRNWDIETLQRILLSLQLDNIKAEKSINKRKFVEEYEKFKKQLLTESDRGLILIVAAYIENILKEVLENKLIGGKKHKKELFSFSSPLGTFSSKVALSFSIGIINKEEQIEINLIRKIRNKFAHSFAIINFETKEINDLIFNLKFYPKDISDLTNNEKIIFSFSIILGRLLSLKYADKRFKEFEPKTDSFEGYYKALKMITQGKR